MVASLTAVSRCGQADHLLNYKFYSSISQCMPLLFRTRLTNACAGSLTMLCSVADRGRDDYARESNARQE